MLKLLLKPIGMFLCRTPGQALASNNPVWLIEANKAPDHVCTRAHLAKVFHPFVFFEDCLQLFLWDQGN